MATRARDRASQGKEKRGTSPSPIHHGRGTNTTSKTTSPAKKQADPTTSNKNIPSYLKPTIAQAKKSASSSDLHNIHNNKPSLTRRQSFDNKPPLPSSSPKTRISPSPRERIPRSSSSLSAKTSTSQKPLLDKLSKTSKDVTGKQRGPGLHSRPVTPKKTATTTTTNTNTRKPDSTNGSTTIASVITNSPDTDQNVTSQQNEVHSEPEDHQELNIQETEKEVITSDGEMAAASDAGDNDSPMDDHEELNGNVNSSQSEDTKAATYESSIVVENQEIKIEEADEKLQVEEPEEISNIEPNEHDSSEKEKEQIVINDPEENHESKGADEGTNNQEKETAKVEEAEAKPEKNMKVESSKPQTQVVHGKNKESVVSNDVIEETATKLREQRKNRVKALAGAFETVISLQEHK